MRLIMILFIIVLGLLIYTNQTTISELIQSTPNDIDTYIIENKTTTTPIQTTIQSKFESTYLDRDGNLHRVTDYTSQGGSKYDEIIKTNVSVYSDTKSVQVIKSNSQNNAIINLSALRSSVMRLINKPENDNDKLIGTWAYSSPGYMEESFTTTFTFSSDSTGMWDNPLIGKLYFKYRLSNDSIILYDAEPCVDNGLWSCKKEASIKYQFYNDRTLFLTFGGTKISFEKQSVW